MEAPHLPNTALPQGSSSLPPNPGFSQVNIETPPLEGGARRHECHECGTGYAQRQGYLLHLRTVHNPKKCILCNFTWARPYAYCDHLLKHHHGVNPEVILGKPAKSRRRATVTEVLPQQPPASPAAVEQGQQNPTESQPNPSSSPSLVAAGDTSVSPPAVSSVDGSSQPVHAGQTATIDENAHGSEFVIVSYPPAVLLSVGERDEPMNDISLQDGQRMPPAHIINLETAPMYQYQYDPMSDADIEEAYNSIFASY